MTARTEELSVVLQRLYDAWAAGDADAFVQDYTDDATVVMPGVFHSGREAIRASMATGFAGPLKGSRGIDELQDVRVLGDTAVVVSRAGILMAGEETLPPERQRVATWVLVRQEGQWKIAAYSNAPA
jgi:uncharacterized protein (TIGR02246 family)